MGCRDVVHDHHDCAECIRGELVFGHPLDSSLKPCHQLDYFKLSARGLRLRSIDRLIVSSAISCTLLDKAGYYLNYRLPNPPWGCPGYQPSEALQIVTLNLDTFFQILVRPVAFIIYFLSGFSPRSTRSWVFGSWSGQRFCDNAASLFEYTHRTQRLGIKITWISDDKAIVDDLRERGYNAHLRWSLHGVFACLRAGVFIFDGLTKDINHWLSRGSERVLLRHGVGTKKVERSIEQPEHHLYKLFHGQWWQRAFWGFLLPWHNVRPNLVISTSPEHARQGELCYGVPADRVVVTGFPRNDALFSKTAATVDQTIQPLLADSRKRGLPLIAYLPTFRDDDSHFVFPLPELDEMAERLGIMLAVKLHFVDGLRAKSFVPNPEGNLRLLDPKVNANHIFPALDGLISDYSSVVYDFMLTNKPVIFFVPDLDEYLRHSRSMFYNFDDVTPGPKARTLEELERALLAVLQDKGQDAWRESYDRVLSKFHTYRDADSSKRVYRTIVERCVNK